MDFTGVRTGLARHDFENMLFEAEKIVRICSSRGIKQVMENDASYPENLKSVADRPFMLYINGEIRNDKNMIAVVGTREPTKEACEINSYFTRELCGYNIGIVSGLAKGHDMIAGKTAIDCEGYTIAVLGCGVDVVYPRESAALHDEIKLKGAMISEYPPGAQPETRNFPQRNRIISGIARAVLVIQAPENSGSLITARYAASQGRELFVVPGNPVVDKNKGSNRLIQEGARMAVSPQDIVMEAFGGALIPEKAGKFDGLSRDEEIVLDRLETETDFEQLLDFTGMSVMDLNHLLMKLELKGLVIQYPGRFYIRNLCL